MYVNVTVNDGTSNITSSHTITELVDFVNNPPTIDPISDVGVVQNGTVNVTVTASDINELTPNLTFTTNRSDITVTALTNTSARLIWIPGPEDVGSQIVQVTVDDGEDTDATTFLVNVTDVNDVPILADVSDITGYYGIRQTLTLVATDEDTNPTLSFSMVPNFFTFTTTSWKPAPMAHTSDSSVSALKWPWPRQSRRVPPIH